VLFVADVSVLAAGVPAADTKHRSDPVHDSMTHVKQGGGDAGEGHFGEPERGRQGSLP
jgi:hypothetical protein